MASCGSARAAASSGWRSARTSPSASTWCWSWSAASSPSTAPLPSSNRTAVRCTSCWQQHEIRHEIRGQGRNYLRKPMSLEQEVELIRQFPIFSKIQPAMQKLLCFSADRLTYAAGQVIFNAGDVGDSAYVIIDGTVEISVPTPSGPIVINEMGKNDLLGEIAIVGEVPRTATAKAITKLETLKISKELFMKIIHENPDAATELRSE